jgi:SOS response regulatory protein OraA/RecX
VRIDFAEHPEKPSVLIILCDEIPWREVHTSIFGRQLELPKQCSSWEEWQEKFNDWEFKQAKSYALKRLSMQAMLSSRLAAMLKERFISHETAEKVVEELVQLGFINDAEWTASFVRTQKTRKVGPRAIAQKLAKKGVRGEDLDQALEGSWNQEEQRSLIIALLKSRYCLICL